MAAQRWGAAVRRRASPRKTYCCHSAARPRFRCQRVVVATHRVERDASMSGSVKSIAITVLALFASAHVLPCAAQVKPFPASFNIREIPTNGTILHGRGPAVLLLHGFGDTGDMWEPLASKLVAD